MDFVFTNSDLNPPPPPAPPPYAPAPPPPPPSDITPSGSESYDVFRYRSRFVPMPSTVA